MLKLQEIPLFSKLTKEQLKALQSRMHIHQYSTNNIVFYEGDTSKYLHVLLEGKVKIYKTTPKGGHVHMHDFCGPDVLALFATFEKVPFPATCEFTSEGTVGLIPFDKIEECLLNTEFSISLIGAMARHIKVISELFHKETIYSSEAKIADLICHNPTVFERLKNTEIASMLNITPETLSRILSRFKKEKIITITNHVVHVMNENALQEILDIYCMNKDNQFN